MTNKISDIQRLLKNADNKIRIGKNDYSSVSLRTELFRREISAEDIVEYASVFTRVETHDDKVITRAYLAEEIDVIINEDGQEIVQMKNVKSTGTSEEDRTSNRINQTSAVENSETSSVGRMLANLGIHGGEMATLEEVEFAVQSGNVVKLQFKGGAKLRELVMKFQNELSQKRFKEEVTDYIIEKSSFFEHLQSNNSELHSDLEKLWKDYTSKLPTQAEYEENSNG
tara:strand:+ start:572 stop:1252 length:681 start_codon:yes stop_codon:yes gene_type:complete